MRVTRSHPIFPEAQVELQPPLAYYDRVTLDATRAHLLGSIADMAFDPGRTAEFDVTVATYETIKATVEADKEAEAELNLNILQKNKHREFKLSESIIKSLIKPKDIEDFVKKNNSEKILKDRHMYYQTYPEESYEIYPLETKKIIDPLPRIFEISMFEVTKNADGETGIEQWVRELREASELSAEKERQRKQQEF